MSGSLLIIEQVAHEDAGVFASQAVEDGYEPELVKIHELQPVPADPTGFAGILIMGGPMNVGQADRFPSITDQIELVRAAHDSGVPVLGVCLGSQIIAAALGADVYSGPKPEIGWYGVDLTVAAGEDILFGEFPEEITVFQWHGQTFDIPDGALRLAGSELYPNQAFRAGECTWGVQFHLEVTERHVREWLEINSGEVKNAGVDAEQIIADTPARLEETSPLAVRLFANFLDVCGK